MLKNKRNMRRKISLLDLSIKFLSAFCWESVTINKNVVEQHQDMSTCFEQHSEYQ